MLVEAIRECFIGRRRKVGARFEYDVPEGGTLPSFLVEITDEAIAKEPPSLRDRVQAAIDQLDPTDDMHWTADRRPATRVVMEIIGQKISKKSVTELCPEAFRPPNVVRDVPSDDGGEGEPTED